MRLLTVDDDPTFCNLLKARLGEIGLNDVEAVFSGESALQKAQAAQNPIECFLVDVRMKPMNGIELVRLLREIPHHQTTPIIMISALTDKGSVDAAFAAGANDYITKPLEMLELKIRLELAKTILVEREQARLLHDYVLKQESILYPLQSFENEIIPEDVDSAISVLSVENFLLKQGNIRLRHNCAIGFHLPMAQAYFNFMEPTHYVGLIGDIALAVSKSLSASPHFLTSPGNGDLVAVLLDQQRLNRETIERRLEEELHKLGQRYTSADLSLPEVWVGEPQRVSLFRSQCPTTLLTRARNAARRMEEAGVQEVLQKIA